MASSGVGSASSPTASGRATSVSVNNRTLLTVSTSVTRRSPSLVGPGSLGPESIDADTAALGQAELGHFGSAVFFPDACAEEDRGDVFEVLADTLKPVYQADDLDGGGVDDADVEAVDQHQGRGSGDAAVAEPARVRG
jgi:hypothetical protein